MKSAYVIGGGGGREEGEGGRRGREGGEGGREGQGKKR